MQAKQIKTLSKEFTSLVANFAQANHVSIRDTSADPHSDSITFHVVLAPAPAANEQGQMPWVGRPVKVEQTESVTSLLLDLAEPEARTLMALYERGALMMGSNPFLKTRGWAGRVVGRATKTRMLEVDVMFNGENLEEPARQRHYADLRKILVPADSGINAKVKSGDRVWAMDGDGNLYRARIARIKGQMAFVDWLDYPEEGQVEVARGNVYAPLAL